ncbi:MAG TPA: transposase [Gemmataceae bacterium]|nr:transposase [Gemmataceae bacterium]
MNQPLAYFLTFTCYGAWLHGQTAGSVDRQHNAPGTPLVPADETRRSREQQRMDQPPYHLDTPRRRIVRQAIQEVCVHRPWELLALHIRASHVHVIVRAEAAPERVLNDFKSYASRALNAAGIDPAECKRWTRHGSTIYLWTEASVEEKVHYVLHEQGAPMEVYVAPSADKTAP